MQRLLKLMNRPFPVGERARALKERIYATLTGLAIISIYGVDPSHATPLAVLSSLALGILGIALAGLMAELVAHMVSHGTAPSGQEFRTMARIAVGALASALLPLIVLIGAASGLIPLALALRIDVLVYLLTLIGVVLLATRRGGMTGRQRLLSIAVLLTFGVLVIVTLAAAHAG